MDTPSVQLKLIQSALFLLLGVIFDLVDGRVARFTGTSSSFGEQFDSLSDMISFGMAPAFLYYFCFLQNSGRLGLALAFSYLLCGAMRLARFNANIEKVGSNFFQGLPIPMAASAVVGLVLLSLDYENFALPKVFLGLYLLFYAILMISTIPFPSFKNSKELGENKKKLLLGVLICLVLVLVKESLIVFVVNAYVVCSMIYAWSTLKKKKKLE